MRVKAYLTSRGVEFDAINITTDPSAVEELTALGAQGIPAVTKGGRFALGMDLNKVDELLGFKKSTEKLASDELIGRIINLIKAWRRFSEQIPPNTYANITPGMEGVKVFYLPDGEPMRLPDGRTYVPHGTYYGLIQHVMRHARIAKLIVEQPTSPVYSNGRTFSEFGEPFPEDGLAELRAEALGIAEYLQRWWADTPKQTLGRDIEERMYDFFVGPQTMHQMLTREAYGLAQHTRQIMTLLYDMGIEPNGPIGEAEYAGLQLPPAVWK